MKKLLFRILLIVALSVLLLTAVSAEETTYFLPKIDMDITAPSDFVALTKDLPEDHAVFQALEKSKDYIMETMEAGGVQFDAVAEDYKREISLTVAEFADGADVNTDEGLKWAIDDLYDLYTSNGLEVSYYEIYQHPQTRFIKIYFTETADNSRQRLQYYTTHDKDAYIFTFTIKDQPVSESFEQMAKGVIDSVRFDASLTRPEKVAEIAPFRYTDEKTGVSFMVPANREQKPLITGNQILDAKFVSTDGSKGTIIYWSTDLWETLSDEEKASISRTDVNNAYYTKDRIAEALDTLIDEVSVVTYNNISYYKTTMDYGELFQLDLEGVMTELIYIENGWMYTFQFDGTNENAGYSDFESILNSVEYPVVATVSEDDEINQELSETEIEEETELLVETEKDSKGSRLIVAVVLVVAAGIGICGIFAYVENRKKKNKHTPKTILICEECGQSVLEDSCFCHHCGAKIKG